MVDIEGHVEMPGEDKVSESQVGTVNESFEASKTLESSESGEDPTIQPFDDTFSEPSAAPSTFQEEIQNYGNSDSLSGPLSYTLIIDGIDTSELRYQLKRVLSDSKLNIEVDVLMPKIDKGHLEIQNMNPVKASVIVQRLLETPLRISWRQHAFSS